MVPLTPRGKVVYGSPVLILSTFIDTSNYCLVIRELLEITGLCAVVEVCALEDKVEGRE